MTSEGSGERPGVFLGLLSLGSLLAALAGAAGSVGLMLRVGHRNHSQTLLTLFTIWVLSPFVALVWAHVVSKRWSVPTRATVYSLMLILTPVSLAVYEDVAFGTPRAQAAAAFLIVPLASWLLIALVLPIAALLSAMLSRRGEGV